MRRSIEDQLRTEAQSLGFDAFGICRADAIPAAADRLGTFIANDWHGDMNWLASTEERRGAPQRLWAGCRSVIMLGISYGPDNDPMERLQEQQRGLISCYAKGRDYHDVIKGRLKQIASKLTAITKCEVKVFVDTAPVMEKPLAEAAGLGWQGKHTNLVSRKHGSWLFLGAIFSSAILAPSQPAQDACGSCRRCLDVCPTDAFPAPYRLDARRCIAYLTIEHKGQIATEFRAKIGNRVFGCDDCLAVCPWNKFAGRSREMRFQGTDDTDDPPLSELADLDEAAFRRRFAGTPVKRTGRDRVVRNVMIAVGNSGQSELMAKARARLSDDAALVRGMAVWATAQLMPADEFCQLADVHLPREHDATVRAEWDRALASGDD
ncbi:MAG: tRNA epoxyqueuosine(34) reductase QueG [Hyphomicrobiaceae bacterium]